MPSLIKKHSVHRGVQIYASANTHPGSKTRSLIIFTEDLALYTGKNRMKRFSYKRMNNEDHTRATAEAMAFINSNVGQLG